MQPGQDVDVTVDAYPGNVFHGKVDSIQRGSAARFSLLPPENATGNYVKVVQRVPVKIRFDAGRGYRLGPGMSVVPKVKCDDGRARIEPPLAPRAGRRHNPWLIAITVTLATFMEVLDTSIANVALPHIAGNLSATDGREHLGPHHLPGGQRDRAAAQRLAQRR